MPSEIREVVRIIFDLDEALIELKKEVEDIKKQLEELKNARS